MGGANAGGWLSLGSPAPRSSALPVPPPGRGPSPAAPGLLPPLLCSGQVEHPPLCPGTTPSPTPGPGLPGRHLPGAGGRRVLPRAPPIFARADTRVNTGPTCARELLPAARAGTRRRLVRGGALPCSRCRTSEMRARGGGTGRPAAPSGTGAPRSLRDPPHLLGRRETRAVLVLVPLNPASRCRSLPLCVSRTSFSWSHVDTTLRRGRP